MAEKKGQTVKLKYDFPEHLCCEVYVPNLEDWFRVTCNEFRSWCGQRRILHLVGDKRKNNDIKAEYKEYDGPTYLFRSNKKINPSNYTQNKIAFLHDKDPRESKPRKHEHFKRTKKQA
jgi:hypothetical protein